MHLTRTNMPKAPEPTKLDTPEWLAFARAVCEAPDDNLPRLVAADWLEESDVPHYANFIRLNIEHGNEPTETWAADSLWNLWAGEVVPEASVALEAANDDKPQIRPLKTAVWNTKASSCNTIRHRMFRDQWTWRPDITKPITPFVRNGFLAVYPGRSADVLLTGHKIFAEHPIRHFIDTRNVRPGVRGDRTWYWQCNHRASDSMIMDNDSQEQYLAGGWHVRLRYGRVHRQDNPGERLPGDYGPLAFQQRHYPTAELALYDLSLAVVDYYRAKAGLPEWNRLRYVGSHAQKFRTPPHNEGNSLYETPHPADPFYAEFLAVLEFARRGNGTRPAP